MPTRRAFLSTTVKAAATLPLWLRLNQLHAQSASSYKAIVCIGLQGGNDGNNMLIPIRTAEYQQYARLRTALAIPQGWLLPLATNATTPYPLAVHPAMPNLAALFNAGYASLVTNVGPMKQPMTKAEIQQNASLLPPSLLSHTAGLAQWESATTVDAPATGWGGRIADMLQGQSGSLPMVLDAGPASLFTVGGNVQGITVQGGLATLAPIPPALQNAALQLSITDSASTNALVAQAAKLHAVAYQQQAILTQAQTAGNTIRTAFPTSGIGASLSTVAQLINGRSVIGATRQIFYLAQGNHDTHTNQLQIQTTNLGQLDAGIGAFVAAMQELGLLNQVLLCTHSDFNRSMVCNSDGGSDHAWGNNQIVVGGGISGGKLIGALPELALGGDHDLNGYGTWIPTQSVTQMAAAAGSWIGLNSTQLTTVFPDLPNFPTGPISFT